MRRCLFFLFFLLFPAVHRAQMCGCSEMVMCPPNSNTTGAGGASLDECVCNPGFVGVGGACVVECQPNSHAFSAQDCRCDAGFVDGVNGTCLKIFDCPLNSTSTAVAHPLSINDCACDSGLVLVNGTTCAAAGLPVAAVAGIAVGGGAAVIAGGVWMFAKPLASIPGQLVSSSMFTGVRLDVPQTGVSISLV